MGTQEQRFFDLFGGHTGAHGQTSVLDTKRRGKQEADYIIIREPLTVELVREHLDGKRGIGSIPITFMPLSLKYLSNIPSLLPISNTKPPFFGENLLITVAAHSRAGLHFAEICGADAVLLSPVFRTTTHPHTRPLGVHKFNLLSMGVQIPIYALGGINTNNARRQTLIKDKDLTRDERSMIEDLLDTSNQIDGEKDFEDYSVRGESD